MNPPFLVLPDAAALAEGRAVRFRVLRHGLPHEAFALRWHGRLVAYLNACRHQHRPLDLGDARFVDGDAIACVHHGARYAPDTGACRDGPCAGGGLTPVTVIERDGAIWCDGEPPPSEGEDPIGRVRGSRGEPGRRDGVAGRSRTEP